MFKKLLAFVLITILAVSFSSCSVNKSSGGQKVETTQKITRIHNNFKDMLPDFKFDSEPVERYEEGISYSFSAECSKGDFKKYIKAVKKAGFDVKPAEGNGYYSAYNAEKIYTEIVLVNDYITVYIKR